MYIFANIYKVFLFYVIKSQILKEKNYFVFNSPLVSDIIMYKIIIECAKKNKKLKINHTKIMIFNSI